MLFDILGHDLDDLYGIRNQMKASIKKEDNKLAVKIEALTALNLHKHLLTRYVKDYRSFLMSDSVNDYLRNKKSYDEIF